MSALPRFNPLTAHLTNGANDKLRLMPFVALPPRLIEPDPEFPSIRASRRTRIWELSQYLHCSIVGTCLSTSELRQVLSKAGLATDGASDHDLHRQGVTLASRRDGTAKLLHKALDKRHRATITRFEKAGTIDEVRALWRHDVKQGDIPGAYWATMTHPATPESLIREVFGEVHMLSHLVGAANRADIRRLSALEAENAALGDKLRKLQDRLHEGFVSRDDKIRELSSMLASHIAGTATSDKTDDSVSEQTALTALVRTLESRLRAEANRRRAIEERLERLTDELGREQALGTAAERRARALSDELEAVEASLARDESDTEPASVSHSICGLSLLYVGGRPDKLGHLRAHSEQLGARFFHHDGGVDDRSGLLAGLVSRADVVMFPVDCVSHDAVGTVKRLCRQMAKPYVPLRSSGMGSFVAALGQAEVATSRTQTSS